MGRRGRFAPALVDVEPGKQALSASSAEVKGQFWASQLRRLKGMAAQQIPELRSLEGRRVGLAVRGGGRIDDCHLVSAGRGRVRTLSVFANGADTFVPSTTWSTCGRRRSVRSVNGGLGPGGRLFELVSGEQRAVISEAGATLRVYEAAGEPVVEPFDGPDTEVVGCQGQLLAPWPNRTVDGRWSWHGAPYQLWITEPERGHALHGLVRTLAWAPAATGPDRITLAATLLEHPGWPFPLAFEVSYALGPDGLVSRLTATNVGRAPCPYGAAVHPYLALGGATVDDVTLDLAAATYVAVDDRLAPTGRRPTAGTPFAFDGARPVGDRRADNAFTGLARLPDGRVEATLTLPDGSRTVVWGDASVGWWQLFTGDALPERWRRTTLAVEPMTCAPDALNSGDGLTTLRPGDSHTMTWGLRRLPS